MIAWFLAGISLIGNLLNSRKIIYGFHIWMVVNVGFLVIDLNNGAIPRAVLDITQLMFNIYGIVQWRKEYAPRKADAELEGEDMIKPTEKEQEFIEKMLETKRQIYLADSYMRKRDLEKGLKRMEREWAEYLRLKKWNPVKDGRPSYR